MVYDIILPLGAACSCTKLLQHFHLRQFSLPFDWLTGGSLLDRVKILTHDFDGWLDKEDIALIHGCEHDTDWYKNNKTGIAYYHDFVKGVPLNESYPNVKNKYDRRVHRLLTKLNEAKNALIVWLTPPIPPFRSITTDEAKRAFVLLTAKYPNTNIKLMVFNYEKAIIKPRITEPAHELKIITFDYKDYNESSFPFYIKFDKLQPFFNDVKVINNHTFIGNIMYSLKKKYTRYLNQRAKYRVKSFLGYVYVHAQYRIYKHLEKALKKRGISLSN